MRPGPNLRARSVAAVGLMMPRRSSPGRSPEIGAAAKTVLRRLPAGGALLVGHIHMRHRVDELPDEIVLAALHQRRHGDGEADADRNAEHRDERLPAAAEDMGQGELDQQPHSGPPPAPAPRPEATAPAR